MNRVLHLKDVKNLSEENDNADKSTSPSALDIFEDNSDKENTGDSSDNETEATVLVEEAAKSVFDAFNSETVSSAQSSDEKQEDINVKTEQSEDKETDDEEDDDSSATPSLASLKAAQTGLPTREAENAGNDYDAMV